MRMLCGKKVWLGVLSAVALSLLIGAGPAQAAFNDPLYVYSAKEDEIVKGELEKGVPPGTGFEGICGLAVDIAGNFYVADYYNNLVDVFGPPEEYRTQFTGVDPEDGPCGLAVDSTGKVYVNDFHHNVARYTPASFPPEPSTEFSPGTQYSGPVFIGEGLPQAEPTGVAVRVANNSVYIDYRTYVGVYTSAGTPAVPAHLGKGSLEDGYGIAVSAYQGTLGQVYVPDAASDMVKVYDPLVDIENPIAEIDKPGGGFTSLKDSGIAVDSATGEIYVADRFGSSLTERPEAAIQVFEPDGTYKGRLKYNVVDAGPVGLAVDNSVTGTAGQVYVTSGNTAQASVYVYPPGATSPVGLPAQFSLAVKTSGSGAGVVTDRIAGIDCSGACTAQVSGGKEIALAATPDSDSTFVGWSGSGCSGTGACVVEMSQAASVTAEFAARPGDVPAGPATSAPGHVNPDAENAVGSEDRVKRHHKAKHRRRAKHRQHRGHRR
jgi:Divergent InlB B-repeat domain